MKPIRMCTVCRKKEEKENLFRIVSSNNKAIYDKIQKINARAIYFCKDSKCIKKAIDMLNKSKLAIKIPIEKDSLINTLKNVESELGE